MKHDDELGNRAKKDEGNISLLKYCWRIYALAANREDAIKFIDKIILAHWPTPIRKKTIDNIVQYGNLRFRVMPEQKPKNLDNTQEDEVISLLSKLSNI